MVCFLEHICWISILIILFPAEKPNSLHILTRTLAGITTGGMAVIFAQPTDVVKVRFQAQKMPAPGETKFV